MGAASFRVPFVMAGFTLHWFGVEATLSELLEVVKLVLALVLALTLLLLVLLLLTLLGALFELALLRKGFLTGSFSGIRSTLTTGMAWFFSLLAVALTLELYGGDTVLSNDDGNCFTLAFERKLGGWHNRTQLFLGYFSPCRIAAK